MWRNFKPTHLAIVSIGLGFLAIILGWNGAAGANCVDCQIPYLLSGGAAGLAFIAVGAGLMLFESGRRGRAHIESKMDELIEAVRDLKGGVSPESNGVAPKSAAAPSKAAKGKGAAETNGMVVVGRASFHRMDCRLVEGKDGLDYATPEEAADRGLSPCRVCDPVAVPR